MFNKKILLLMGIVFAINSGAAERSVAVSSAELNVTNAKTDVLGRHNSKVRWTPQAYVKEVKKNVNQNFLAKAVNYSEDFNEIKIDSTWGVFEYRADKKGTMLTKYELNGKTLDRAEYLSQIEKIEDADKVRKLHIEKRTKDCPNNDVDENYRVNVIPDDCSGKNSCVVKKNLANGVPENIDYWNYASIVKKSNLYTYAVKPGYVGRNIGISFTEAALPLNSFFPANRYMRLSSSHPSASEVSHGTKVARVLNHVASKAKLYGYQNMQNEKSACKGRNVFIPDDGYKMNPKIYIGNHSYGDPENGAAVSKYLERTKDIDNFIYNTRTIEIASMGNSGHLNGAQSSTIAMGVNVISVGAVHNNLTYHQTSSWRNPVYRTNESVSGSGQAYVKPEIANFADFLFPADKAYSIESKSFHKQYYIDLTFSQTSAATPYTTASVALLLDRFPFYKWHPEVVKALLITSSILPITDAKQHDKDNESKYAMGVPEGRAMFQYNRSRFWNGNEGDFFNRSNEIRFEEIDIDPTRTYRIAIAWLSSGSYVYENGRLPQDINLEVRQDGDLLGSSASVSNPFEFVEIKPKTNHNLTIIITRKSNYYGRVLLGYNLLEVH